jgi:hypothetical protein
MKLLLILLILALIWSVIPAVVLADWGKTSSQDAHGGISKFPPGWSDPFNNTPLTPYQTSSPGLPLSAADKYYLGNWGTNH